MKHTKFSKLISIVLTVAVVMLSSVSAFAGASVTATRDVASTKVTIDYKGTVEGINPVGLAVVVIGPGVADGNGGYTFDETKNIITGAQLFADENGNYKGDLVLSNEVDDQGKSVVKSGYYKVVVSSADEVVNSVFFFARPAETKDALKIILEATTDQPIVDTIDEFADVLGIDSDLWDMLKDNATAKANAAACIRANETLKTIDKENIKDSDVALAAVQMNKEIFTAIANANKGLIKDLNDYKDIIENKDALDFYNGLTDAAKAEMIKLISGKNYANFEALNDDLMDMGKLAYINADGSDLTKVTQYFKDLGLEKASTFESLASNKLKTDALTEVKNANATTVADLNKALTAAVKGKNTGSTSGSVSDRDTGKSDKDKTEIKSDVVNPGDENALKYIDIDNYAWAKDAIYELTELNVLTGYGDGLFGPANPIKREEFAKVIVSAMYAKEADSANVTPAFTDAQNAWYSSYIGYAAQIGIISGFDDTTFGVGQNIKRQDIMAILYRIMVAKGYSVNTSPISYTDANDIYDYAKDAVYALANAGVVSGYNGAINPNGEATRAEVAVMVSNFIKLFK